MESTQQEISLPPPPQAAHGHLLGAIICTTFWAASFPIILYVTLMTLPEITRYSDMLYVHLPLILLIPISIFCTIAYVWRNYVHQKIARMYWGNLIPIIVTIISTLLNAGIFALTIKTP